MMQDGSWGLPQVNRTQLLTSEIVKDKSGTEWIKVVEAGQPRELVPLFQRLAQTQDGR